MNQDSRRLGDRSKRKGGGPALWSAPRARQTVPHSNQREADPAALGDASFPWGLTWPLRREASTASARPSGATQDCAQPRTLLSSAADPVPLRRLPKPALPLRDPTPRTASWEVWCRPRPPRPVPLVANSPAGENEPSQRLCPTLLHRLSQPHIMRPQVPAPVTPEPTGLQIPQCHSRGRTSSSGRTGPLLLPTCYSGGGSADDPVPDKMVRGLRGGPDRPVGRPWGPFHTPFLSRRPQTPEIQTAGGSCIFWLGLRGGKGSPLPWTRSAEVLISRLLRGEACEVHF